MWRLVHHISCNPSFVVLSLVHPQNEVSSTAVTIAFLASSVLATLKHSILNPPKKHFARYQLSLLDLSPGGYHAECKRLPPWTCKRTQKEDVGSDLHDSREVVMAALNFRHEQIKSSLKSRPKISWYRDFLRIRTQRTSVSNLNPCAQDGFV